MVSDRELFGDTSREDGPIIRSDIGEISFQIGESSPAEETGNSGSSTQFSESSDGNRSDGNDGGKPRRGRPPGSKNKTSSVKVQTPSKIDVDVSSVATGYSSLAGAVFSFLSIFLGEHWQLKPGQDELLGTAIARASRNVDILNTVNNKTLDTAGLIVTAGGLITSRVRDSLAKRVMEGKPVGIKVPTFNSHGPTVARPTNPSPPAQPVSSNSNTGQGIFYGENGLGQNNLGEALFDWDENPLGNFGP